MAAERAVFVAELTSIAGVVGLLNFAADLVEAFDGINYTPVDDVYPAARRRVAKMLAGGFPAIVALGEH